MQTGLQGTPDVPCSPLHLAWTASGRHYRRRVYCRDALMSRSRWLLLILLLLGLLLYLPYRLQLRETAVLDAAARQQLGGTYLALPQGVVHYELAGPAGAPVVVLVHGFSVPSYLWDRTVAPLQQAGYRVLRFDLYGRGYSDRPDVDYGLDVYVSQLRDLLAGLQLRQPVHLVGLSMGGPIVTRFSHRFPQQVASVSLLAPLVQTPARAGVTLLRQPLLGDYLASVALVPKVRSSLATLVHDPASFPDFEQRFDRQAAYAGYARALLRTVRYLDGRDFLADYRALAQTGKPVQLIWGENDLLVPIEQAQWLQQAVPGVPLQRIARSGHLPQYEHPQQVNRLLLDFLQRQHPAASAKR